MFKKILVSYDGSEPSIRAVEQAVELAVICEAAVEILQIVGEPEESTAAFETAARQAMVIEDPNAEEEYDNRYIEAAIDDAVEATKDLVKPIDDANLDLEYTVMIGDPKEMISKHINAGDYDLVVMGRRGLGAFKGLIGSVSQRVLRDVKAPVMLIR